MTKIWTNKELDNLIPSNDELNGSLINSIQAAVVVHDADTKIISVNLKAMELLGLSKDQMLGKTAFDPVWKFADEDGLSIPTGEYPVIQVLATQKPVKDFILCIHRPNKENPVWVNVYADPVWDTSGLLKHVVVTFMDVTKQKYTETQLEKDQKLFGDVLDAVPDMVWLKDANGVYLTCNQELAKLVNSTKEKIIGRTDYDIFPLEKADFYGEHDRNAIENRVTTINEESADYLHEGYSIWIETSKTPVYDQNGELIGVLGIGRDISRSKQNLKESEEKQAFLNMVVDLSPVPMLICSPNWTALRANKAFSSALNLTAKQTVGKYNLLQDENLKRADIAEKLDLVIQKKQPVKFNLFWKSDLVRHVNFSSGRNLYVDVSIFPLLNQDGEMTHIVAQWVDITDLKHSEQKLLESESRFRTIFEQAAVGVALVESMTGRFLRINKRYCEMVGYTIDEMSAGRTFQEITHPDDRHHDLENMTQLIAGDIREFTIEKRYTHKNGSIVWANLTVSPTWKIGDEPKYHIAVVEDITERKVAEINLKESERMLSTLVGNLPGMAYRCFNDGNWTMIFLSDGCKSITGYEPYQIIDNRELAYNDLIVPDDRPYVRDEIQRAIDERRQFTLEYRIRDKHGTERWIWEKGLSVDKQKDRVLILEGFISDITERKLAEEAFRKSESRYRSLFENAVEGFFQSTPDGRFLSVNPAFTKMLGYASPEKLIENITDIQTEIYVDPEDRDRYQRILRDHGKIENFEVRFRRKDGSKIWVSKSTRATFNETGDIERFEGIVINIDERKKAEAEKIKLEKQLAQAQKLESIGNLAGGIAHDFNNILSSVLGFTELSFDEVEKGSTLDDNLQEVYAAGKRAKDLVRQILAFARQSEEEIKPIRVDLIVKEVLKLIRSSTPTTIEIKQDLTTNSSIMGNPTQVHQMLMNLCANAAFAMEEDGGILKIELKDMTIANPEKRNALGLRNIGYIQLTVSDTGTGIPNDALDSIFEPYFTTKGHGEGTGMGLAMVDGIVDSYKGKITVDSTIGKGSIFRIYLPATRKSQTHRHYASEQLPTGNERILFVDDEASIAKIGTRILQSLGYSVVSRTSSIEALEYFRSKPNGFDLIVTDMTMPNMTGDKLAIELMRIQPDIPVILCTGYSKKISDETLDEAGIKALAYKPIVKADLAKTIRGVLDEAKG